MATENRVSELVRAAINGQEVAEFAGHRGRGNGGFLAFCQRKGIDLVALACDETAAVETYESWSGVRAARDAAKAKLEAIEEQQRQLRAAKRALTGK